jgi:hypothetical protein
MRPHLKPWHRRERHACAWHAQGTHCAASAYHHDFVQEQLQTAATSLLFAIAYAALAGVDDTADLRWVKTASDVSRAPATALTTL